MEPNRLSALLKSLSGPKATSYRAVLPGLILVSLGTMFRQEMQDLSQLLIWLGIVSQALLAALVLFLLGRVIVDRVTANSSMRRLSIGIYYFSIEAVRAVAIDIAALQAIAGYQPNWSYSIVAGGVTGVTLFGAASVILNDSEDYRLEYSKLLEFRIQIQEAIERSKTEIQTKRQELVSRISEAVENTLQSVLSKSRLSKQDAMVFANKLIQLSEDVVRPLSHEIFQGAQRQFRPTDSRSFKIRLSRVLSLVPNTAPFRVWPFVLITIVLSLPAAILASSKPVNAVLSVVILVIWFSFWLQLLSNYLLPVLKKQNLAIQWSLLVIGLLLMPTFPIAFFLAADERDLPSAAGLVSYILILTVVAGLVLAIYPAIERARREIINEVAQANSTLAWNLARLGSILRIEERNLARKLHKDIQGTLVASALRLQRIIEERKNPKAAIEKIRKDLSKAVLTILEPDKPLELTKLIKRLNAGWKPVFELKLMSSSDTLQRVNSDLVALAAISDLVSEFATNSVKHGAASSGTVELELISEQILRVHCENNGRPLPNKIKPGLGTKLATAMAIRIDFETLRNGVRFSADLALADVYAKGR